MSDLYKKFTIGYFAIMGTVFGSLYLYAWLDKRGKLPLGKVK